VDFGDCQKTQKQDLASRPLLAAGSPLNTRRVDTSRGNCARHVASHVEPFFMWNFVSHSLPSNAPIIPKCNANASEMWRWQRFLPNVVFICCAAQN
jgi:hypothetical protein